MLIDTAHRPKIESSGVQSSFHVHAIRLYGIHRFYSVVYDHMFPNLDVRDGSIHICCIEFHLRNNAIFERCYNFETFDI